MLTLTVIVVLLGLSRCYCGGVLLALGRMFTISQLPSLSVRYIFLADIMHNEKGRSADAACSTRSTRALLVLKSPCHFAHAFTCYVNVQLTDTRCSRSRRKRARLPCLTTSHVRLFLCLQQDSLLKSSSDVVPQILPNTADTPTRFGRCDLIRKNSCSSDVLLDFKHLLISAVHPIPPSTNH